jgi:putative transposase
MARSSLYVWLKRPPQDKAPIMRIEAAHEGGDTMGHWKFSIFLETGKNCVKRVTHIWDCSTLQTHSPGLGIVFDYHMRADLVTTIIHAMNFKVPVSIWHSEEAHTIRRRIETGQLLLQKGFVLSISRVGAPLGHP